MAAVFNEREASSRSACWFQRGRSVVVQRRAPGALRESSSLVPGDQSGRPGDGRLPFGAVRRAMPAALASVQKRRWRRALPAVTQTYTESCRQGQDNFILGLFESGSVECRAGAGAGEASLALRRDACVGVGRRGSAGLLRARAAFDVRIHMYLHTTTKNLARRAPSSRRCSRRWTWRRRRSPGTAARPASESSDDCWPAQAWWTTTSLGPPNCHTEQWSLPPAHVHGQNRPLSRVFLGRTRIP